MTDEKLIDGIRKGLESWSHLYITKEGRKVKANRLAEVKTQMREAGWRNVSRIDERECQRLGFEVVNAYYGQRARTVKRFCDVVVLCDWKGKS